MTKIAKSKIFWIIWGLVLIVGWLWSYPAYFDWLKDFRPRTEIDEGFLKVADKAITSTERSISLPAIPDARIFKWSNEEPVYDMFQAFTSRGSLSFRNPYSGLMLYFLNEEIEQNRPVGIYLRSLGIERVYLRLDTSSKVISEIQKLKNLELFSSDPDLELLESSVHLAVFRVKEPNPEVFSNQETVTIIGGLDAYRQLELLDNFDLTKNNIVFAHQSLGPQMRDTINNSQHLVFSNNQTSNDLVYNFLNDYILLRPAEFARAADPENNWVAASVYEPVHGEWHKVLREILGTNNWDYDYGLGLVYSNRLEKTDSPPPVLGIPFTIKEEANYLVSARIFKHLNGGEIEIKIDDGPWHKINCGAFENRLAWEENLPVYLDAGEHQLFIKNNGGFNAINALILTPENELQHARNVSSELLSRKNVVVVQDVNAIEVLAENQGDPGLIAPGKTWNFSSTNEKSFRNLLNDVTISLYEKFELATKNINYTSPGPFIDNDKNDSIRKVGDFWQITSPAQGDRIALGAFPVQANNKYYFRIKASCDGAERLNFRILQYHNQAKVEAKEAITADTVFMSLNRDNGETDFIFPVGVRNNIQFLALEITASNFSQADNFNWRITTPELYSAKDLEPDLGSLAIFDPNLNFANKQLVGSVEKYQPGQIELSTPAPVSQFSLTQAYDPLWEATADQKELPSFANYGVLTAFVSPEVIDRAEVYYFPEKPYRLGLLISVLALGLFGLIFALKLAINRKKSQTK